MNSFFRTLILYDFKLDEIYPLPIDTLPAFNILLLQKHYFFKNEVFFFSAIIFTFTEKLQNISGAFFFLLTPLKENNL